MRSSKNGKWPRLMFQTKKLKVLLWILSIALGVVCAGLTGCGSVQPLPTATSAPSAAPTTPPTFTSVAPLPTLTPGNPTSLTISTPIPSPAPIPISTATEIYLLDNLRMAYIVDGNLYVQNGSNPPQQLTDSGQDIYPMFSDDGEKIVFYRGKINDNNSIFSVNANGSQMQKIITKDWLDTLGTGTKAGHLAFVPDTHQIIFNTYLCPGYNPSSDLGCTVGLFLINTDTGELKEIMSPVLGSGLPWDGTSPWRGNFSISPDGKLLSVAHAGQIDILDIDGNIVHRNFINYVRSAPIEFYPRVYWLSNSNDLLIALPIEAKYYMGSPPKYVVWQYTLDENIATQIPLNPSPTMV